MDMEAQAAEFPADESEECGFCPQQLAKLLLRLDEQSENMALLWERISKLQVDLAKSNADMQVQLAQLKAKKGE